MATHLFPDNEDRQLTTFVNDPRLRSWAEESERILRQLPSLKVWEVQYKGQGVANTCWYVGINTQKKPYLINFTMIPSNLNVEFRFSQYLPKDVFEKLKWQNSSWRYADIKTYGTKAVKEMIERYIANIKEDLVDGNLRQGGKSFAETLIFRSLSVIFKGQEILENERPDDLRSERNTPLELDLYIPKLKIAFELQGPQHFKEIYGSNVTLKQNDQLKKQWCRDKGIRLIWMNWDGFNKNLLRLSFEQRTKEIRRIINRFIDSGSASMWWKGSSDFHYE